MPELLGRDRAAFADLLTGSYARLLGRLLVPDSLTGEAAADWLYASPAALLVHDTAPDPLFVYANLAAQQRFGYSWNEFVGLPSRLSAGEDDRATRAALLDGVTRDGFLEGYRGQRVRKDGTRFWINGVTVWNLLDPNNYRVGQAALLRT